MSDFETWWKKRANGYDNSGEKEITQNAWEDGRAELQAKVDRLIKAKITAVNILGDDPSFDSDHEAVCVLNDAITKAQEG